MKRLKIGYLTAGSADDILNWSGLVKHIRDALEDYGHEIYAIDGFWPRVPIATRLRGWRSRFILGKPYGYDRDVSLALSFARLAEKKIARLSLDCIVSAQTYPATMLSTAIPVASWCDATFHALMGIYPGCAQISEDSIQQGHYLERNAISRSCFLAYASRWAADDAIRYYGADPNKVEVVPFGANCAPAFTSSEAAREAVLAKPQKPFRILFVGRDWHRKGGPLTLEILSQLRGRGVNAELCIIGCEPFPQGPPPAVTCFGLLDKSNPVQLATWRNCFAKSHVLVVPTRAECFGVVFSEAAAFALPSVAAAIGGVPDAVADGTSGFLFDSNDSAVWYVDVLQHLANDRVFYYDAAMRAYGHYCSTLNWGTAAARFTELLLQRLKARPDSRFRAPSSKFQVQRTPLGSESLNLEL